MAYKNPYTYAKVKAMGGREVAAELQKFGIKPGTKGTDELKEILVKKGREMSEQRKQQEQGNKSNESVAQIRRDISNLEGRVITLTKSIGEINETLENLYLALLDATDAIKKNTPSKVTYDKNASLTPVEIFREVNDGEIEQFVKSLNPYEIANTKTKDTYDTFCNWCAKRKLIPGSQIKLTKRICHEYPFQVTSQHFRAIANSGC